MDSNRHKGHEATIDEITRRNVDTIARLERLAQNERSWSVRLADGIAAFCGSWYFVILHALWFGLWIGFGVEEFPFGLLTMVVSLEAIFLSTIIMISQNRQNMVDARRNHLDLQINLLAEQESTEALRLLRHIARKLDVRMSGADERAFEEETRPDRIISEIEKRVEEYKKSKD